jgi:hypothetical protein
VIVAGYAALMAIPALIAVCASRESRGQDISAQPAERDDATMHPAARTLDA